MVARRRLVAERAPMELRQWVRRVLGGGGAREQRDAWDAVWAAVLDAVLRDDELPDATPRDIEQELLQFFKDHDIEEGRHAAVGEAWSTNRGGPAEAWSELWARLAARDGSSEWLHLSSRDCDRHAELQLVDAVNARPQLRRRRGGTLTAARLGRARRRRRRRSLSSGLPLRTARARERARERERAASSRRNPAPRGRASDHGHSRGCAVCCCACKGCSSDAGTATPHPF